MTILGVHSPEFEFEKDYDNVVEAVEKHELEYPVVRDNNFRTRRLFGNRYWPTKYLLDANGKMRFRHIGEGAYQETELAIRALLEEAGNDVSGIDAEFTPG